MTVLALAGCGGGDSDPKLPPVGDGGAAVDRTVVDGVPAPRDATDRDGMDGKGGSGGAAGDGGLDGGGGGVDGGPGGAGGSGGMAGSGGSGGKAGSGGSDGGVMDAPVDGAMACNLLTQNCKPAGLACFPNNSVSGGTECLPAGFLAPGDMTTCTNQADCVKGAMCAASIGGSELHYCTPICEVAKPACGAGQVCKPLAAYPGVGYCAAG